MLWISWNMWIIILVDLTTQIRCFGWHFYSAWATTCLKLWILWFCSVGLMFTLLLFRLWQWHCWLILVQCTTSRFTQTETTFYLTFSYLKTNPRLLTGGEIWHLPRELKMENFKGFSLRCPEVFTLQPATISSLSCSFTYIKLYFLKDSIVAWMIDIIL